LDISKVWVRKSGWLLKKTFRFSPEKYLYQVSGENSYDMPTTDPSDHRSGYPQFPHSPAQRTASNEKSRNQSATYVNVLETIVVEEVEQQLEKLPPHLAKYINLVQVVAYALNRLPSMYATSEEGWQRQQLKARNELREQIFMAVRQGLAAVQKDPLKVTTPLKLRGNLDQPQGNPEKLRGAYFGRSL